MDSHDCVFGQQQRHTMTIISTNLRKGEKQTSLHMIMSSVHERKRNSSNRLKSNDSMSWPCRGGKRRHDDEKKIRRPRQTFNVKFLRLGLVNLHFAQLCDVAEHGNHGLTHTPAPTSKNEWIKESEKIFLDFKSEASYGSSSVVSERPND